MSRNIFRSSKPRWLVAAVAVGASISIHFSNAAESSPPSTNAPSVTLDVLVADVLEHNPELNFYRAEVAAAKGERRTAATFANPELSTTIGDKHVVAGPVNSDGLAWSVSVKQAFEWPGRIPLRKAIANHQIKLAELGLDQFRVSLAARARALAFSLFAAQEKALAAREVAERFQALREVLVQRDSAGLTPVLETRIIEASELTLQRKATEATLAEQSALLELNQLRGQPWGQSLRIEPPKLVFPAFPGPEPFLASVETNNFEIRMRQAELEQQGLKVSLAKNEKYPAVTIGPYLSQERSGDRETQVGIGLSIPVPLWNRNGGRVATEEQK